MKKRSTLLFLLITFCATVFVSAQRESYYVIQQTNFLKDKGYKIYTEEEYKEIQEQMALERRYFRQVLKEAQNQWDEAQKELAKSGNRTVMFPAASISPRTVMLKGKYSDKEKAGEKLAQLEEAEYEKLYGKSGKNYGYQKPKKSDGNLLKEEQKRLLGVEAGTKFQKLYSDFIKEKTGKEAPTYIDHVEPQKKH